MKRTFLPLFLGLFLFPILLQAGSLHGKVIDATTRQALVGASLKLDIVVPDSVAMFATSDLEGNFVINDILPGNAVYALSCNQSGYVSFRVRLDDVGTGDHGYDVELQPEGSSPPPPGTDSTLVIGLVQGRLQDGSIAAIGGAQVTVSWSSGQKIIVADADGHFTYPVIDGVYQFEYAATGYVGLIISQQAISGGRVTFAGVLSSAVVSIPPLPVPGSLQLYDAYPNPFNPSTTVKFSLPQEQYVKIVVFDALGREIQRLFEGVAPAGEHKLTFESGNLSSGVYFYRLVSENGATLGRRMVLAR